LCSFMCLLMYRIEQGFLLVLHCSLAGAVLGLGTCIVAGIYHPYAIAGLLLLGGLLGLLHAPVLWWLLRAKPLLASTWAVFAPALVSVSLATALGLRRLPLLAVTLVSIWTGIWIVKTYIRDFPTPGHCVECAYDLTGNISGICPECGTPIPDEVKEQLITAPPKR